MPGTRRTPIARQHKPAITPLAVELFVQWREAPRCTCPSPDAWIHRQECDGCRQRSELRHQLHRELHCKLWEDVVELPGKRNPYPPDHGNHTWWKPDLAAQARWKALEDAAFEMGYWSRPKPRQQSKLRKQATGDGHQLEASNKPAEQKPSAAPAASDASNKPAAPAADEDPAEQVPLVPAT
jgi:hypothetical protein